MTIETAADILPPGIDTSAILNDKTSSKILANAQPQVLGAATEKPKSKLTPIIAAPINNGQYQEYLFAGLIILVSGFSGLILKLRQQ